MDTFQINDLICDFDFQKCNPVQLNGQTIAHLVNNRRISNFEWFQSLRYRIPVGRDEIKKNRDKKTRMIEEISIPQSNLLPIEENRTTHKKKL